MTDNVTITVPAQDLKQLQESAKTLEWIERHCAIILIGHRGPVWAEGKDEDKDQVLSLQEWVKCQKD